MYKHNFSKLNCIIFLRRYFVLSLLFLLFSCFSIKPGGVKTAKKLYESFYIGEDGSQYFIKPLNLQNDANAELKIDFTFRYKNEIKDSVIINITFVGSENFKVADSISIENENISIISKEINYLFSERKKRTYNSRFSIKTKLDGIQELFESSNWKMVLYENGNQHQYVTIRSTKRKIDQLRYEIFSLF